MVAVDSKTDDNMACRHIAQHLSTLAVPLCLRRLTVPRAGIYLPLLHACIRHAPCTALGYDILVRDRACCYVTTHACT